LPTVPPFTLAIGESITTVVVVPTGSSTIVVVGSGVEVVVVPSSRGVVGTTTVVVLEVLEVVGVGRVLVVVWSVWIGVLVGLYV